MESRVRGGQSFEDDAVLVRRAANGDPGAFDELVRRHRPSVLRFVRSRVRDPQTADDVTQDAFEVAFTHLHQLREGSSFGAWVRTVAARLTTKLSRVPLTEPLVIDIRDDVGDSPERVAERRETVFAVRSAIAELSVADRELIRLRHLEERPVEYVAHERGLTRGAADVALSRARKRLRVVCEAAETLAWSGAVWVARRFFGRGRGHALDGGILVVAAALPMIVVAGLFSSRLSEPDARSRSADAPGDVASDVAPVLRSDHRLGTVEGRARAAAAAASWPDDVAAYSGPRSSEVAVVPGVAVSRSVPAEDRSASVLVGVEADGERYESGMVAGAHDVVSPGGSCPVSAEEHGYGMTAGPAVVTVDVASSRC